MSCENCKSGFSWDGTPTGQETTLGDNRAYVSGTSKTAAILIVHDLFGWTFTNMRLLADHFAKEVDATVYLVDYFDNEIVDPETMDNPQKTAAFDIPAFIARNTKTKRYPEISASANTLKSTYPKVGAIGYCYGAWAVFRLGASPSTIDAISAAHPSLLETHEMDGVSVPVQILAPEKDVAFTQELKEYANRVLPTRGVPYEYVFFPGVKHGFAARGNSGDEVQRASLERAKRCAVGFFKEFLH